MAGIKLFGYSSNACVSTALAQLPHTLSPLSGCFKKVSRVFQLRLKGFPSSFRGFQGYLKEVQKVCQGSFNGVSESFKDVQESFKSV